MNKCLQCLLAVIMAIFMSGCVFGSYVTRVEDKRPDKSFFGKYPYSDVVWDIKEVPTIGGSKVGQFGGMALISIPLDLVADTVFLPFDLIGWLFGYSKGNI